MFVYIIRLGSRALLLTLLGTLVFYTLLVYLMPSGPYSRYRVALAQVQHDHITEITVRQKYPGGGGTFIDTTPLLTVRNYEEAYSLDKPWPFSFFAWLYDPNDTTYITRRAYQVLPKGLDINIGGLHITGDGMLVGGWGISEALRPGMQVRDVIGGNWFNTTLLVATALLLIVLLAVPIGIIGAVRVDTRVDHGLTFFSYVGQSMPPFVTGMFLILGLAVVPYQLHNNLNWTWVPYLPPGDVTDVLKPDSLSSRLYHLVLPVAALVIGQAAWLSRHVRFSMLEVLSQDYVRTAYAKGAGFRRVVLRHAWRNALLPFITSVALAVPGMVAGVVVVEYVFNYNGMGRLFFDAARIGLRDTSLLLTLIVIMIVAVTLSNMLADILYAVVDPRVSSRGVR